MNETNLTVYICDNCGAAALAGRHGADCPCGGTYSMTPAAPVTINLTPHVIRLNDGTEYPPSGAVARVSAEYMRLAPSPPPCYSVVYGKVTGLPVPQDGVDYIVSGMVAAACKERHDLLVPATGHPDAVRKDGQVYSVPGFIVP
jgi:hypothetical protein